MKKKHNIGEVIRFNPTPKDGLTNEQVKDRQDKHLTNKTTAVVGKTYWQIIQTNVFSLFNIMLFIIAGLMIYTQNFGSMFFMVVLIPNIVIGLYQDIKARRLMDKLRVVNAPRAVVIRDGQKIEVPTEQIVLDDVVYLTSNNQISADCILLEGNIAVNESLLTGEPDNIYKKPGDILYSGSYVVSGSGYVKADKVGSDSYIENLQGEAKKFKSNPSEILKSFRILFRGIAVIVVISALATILTYVFKGQLNTEQDFKDIVKPLSGSLVSMIPSGLYLLTSMALATGVIILARKKAQVQEFYSIEMLSRTDVLCVDKTGTITDGTMNVNKVIPIGSKSEDEIDTIMSNVIRLIGDNNSTASALLKHFDLEVTMSSDVILPFDSKNKYSGVTLKNGTTYIFGACEFLNITGKDEIEKTVSEYSNKGYRVLVLGESKEPIKNNKFVGTLTPLAIIVIQDHIKETAYDTFTWFKDNGVAVKVISGDNANTVSEIARQAGIENYDKFISLDGLSDEEVVDAANKYTVFGRVTPEQKALLVQSIKAEKHTVAMTGDGVNDILALKKADCSIAMASGADSARNVSHIVLMDSDFSHLPEVVAEGRRVVNNLQRTCSVFIVKTTFAVIMTWAFLIASMCTTAQIDYPFSTNNMYLWELLGIGLTSFFLALQINNERIKGKFLSNILKRAIPAGLVTCLIAGTIFGLFFMQDAGLFYLGINSIGFAKGITEPISGATAMATIGFTLFSFVVLGKICFPFDKYRKIVFSSACVIATLALVVFGLQSFFSPDGNNILRINFSSLSLVNYLLVIAVVVIYSILYLYISFLISYFKEKKGNKNGQNK